MKYITEDDLREKYHDLPFDTFTVETTFRLTPGARMFLTDRKIKIFDKNDREQMAKIAREKQLNENHNKGTAPPEHSTSNESLNTLIPVNFDNSRVGWLSLRCSLLKAASDVAEIDLILAQDLCSIERCVASISNNEPFILPTFIQLGKEKKEVNRDELEGKLSSVALFLKTDKGVALTRLYPIYFQIDDMAQILKKEEGKKLSQISNLLGLLIDYYLGGPDDDGK